MSTHTQILYQIVFSTYKREKTLTKENRESLYKYIWGILQKKNCHLYRINGIEDHIHILASLHPSIALSNLVKDLKLSTSKWIKEEKIFPMFSNWQNGYGAFTYSIDAKDDLIKYIKNQKDHHKIKSFKEEYIELLTDFKIPFEEKYLL